MGSSLHSMLPRMAIVLTPLTLGLAIYGGYRWRTRVYDVPRNTDIFTIVEGSWTYAGGEGDCTAKFLTISFTANHTDMVIERSPGYRGVDQMVAELDSYPLLGHTRHSIRVVRRGETELNADSTPVVWEVVLRSANKHTWRRSDWLPLQFTREMKRC